MSPKISVVLPVYNGETYLRKSIESILNQTYSDFELIIVDDCSIDKTGEIAKEYAKIDQRIIYLKNDTNLKLPESLNQGFAKAIGTYWTWTSCDNIYLPNAFEKMLSILQENKEVGLVYASMQIIDENGQGKDIFRVGPAEHLIFRNVVGACFLYRRSVAEKIGSYDASLFLCEDYEYWLRIASISKIHPIEECLYQYRRHTESLSHMNEKEVIAKGIGVQRKYAPFFIKTRKQTALFYAHLRARDIYNTWRQFYLLFVFFYSPYVFFKEIYGLIVRRLK